MTETHAVEVDFARKWAESIGQSLHYAKMTGKHAGVVLVISRGDERYIKRIKEVIDEYNLPVDVWLVEKISKPRH